MQEQTTYDEMHGRLMYLRQSALEAGGHLSADDPDAACDILVDSLALLVGVTDDAHTEMSQRCDQHLSAGTWAGAAQAQGQLNVLAGELSWYRSSWTLLCKLSGRTDKPAHLRGQLLRTFIDSVVSRT